MPLARLATLAAAVLLAWPALPALAQRPDTIVKQAGAPRHPGVATLVKEMSIGVVDGADEYMLGSVSEIAVARDGSIYVYDRQAPALRKYDAQGKFVKTFGRKGRGPGEYLDAGGLALTADGRVLLWDTGNWRINVYSPDGTVLPSWSTLSGAGGNVSMSTGRSLMVDTAGRTYVRRRLFGARAPSESRTVWIRYRPDGTPLDTIGPPRFTAQAMLLTAASPGGRATTSMGVPFAPTPRTVMSPLGHLVTGLADRYAFEIHAVPGRPVTSVRRNVEAVSVTRHERDSARDAVVERMRRTEPAWSWNGPGIPAHKPYYADLFAADDGRIWVAVVGEVAQRVGSVSGGGGGGGPARPNRPAAPASVPPTPRPALYDVFEPNGAYVGQVEVPPRVSTVVRRGDYVWGVEFDDDDVQRVVRFRIVWR